MRRVLPALLACGLAVPALAAPEGPLLRLVEPELPDRVPWQVDPDEVDDLLEDLAGLAPDDAEGVFPWARGPDGVLRPLEDYLPEIPPVPNRHAHLSHMPEGHPGLADGGLSGKTVYISQCHGWIWNNTLNRFALQRPNLFDTVEDLHNVEAASQYLTSYLENAGAAVFTVKERDLNPRMAIADNDGEGYFETGEGFVNGGPGFADQGTWAYGQNPFAGGTTRRFPADGGAVATWVPEVPADGWYAVYVSWRAASDNAQDAHYRIHHPGGVYSRRFDQTVHGSTWQYVDTLWLPAGIEGLKVELVGDSAQAGRWLSADAVRIGGGMGVITRHGLTHNRPRWEEGAVLSTQFNGAPTSVYDAFGNGNGSDPASRSRWAAWEYVPGEDAVYLSWHSNAASGTARGTSTHIYGSHCAAGAPVAGSLAYAQAVQDEISSAFQANWEPTWNNRGVRHDCFAEVNPSHNPHMPAALVELAFHDNEADTTLLKHPRFRRDAARAMYRGILRYFAERDGVTPVYLPEPPVDLAIRHGADGRLVASWAPGPSGFPDGDPADHYVLFTSPNGRSWDQGTSVSGTSTVLDTAPGELVYVRVAGVNEGGMSFPSKVMAGLRSPDGTAPVLIVDAFDRLDRGLLDWDNPHSSIGWVVRMNLRHMNPGDIVVNHAQAVADAGWPFDSTTQAVFDDLDLSPYRVVFWANGEQSTVDETFTTHQQQRFRDYLDAGGTLFASGAEILWDLDHRGSASDQAFAVEVLGATLHNDSAGTTRAHGVGILEGVGAMDFGMEDGAQYPVEWPDSMFSDREPFALYDNGQLAGVIGEGVALLGYPFDTIGDPEVRADVALRLLQALVPDYEPPDLDDPGDGVADDDDPHGDGPGRRVPKQAGCGCGPGLPAGGLALPLLALGLALRRRS